MKTLIALIILALVACAPTARPVTEAPELFNPLNTPGDSSRVPYFAGDIHARTFASDFGH